MSNYTATTNFASKDTLTTGDPDKVIKGSEFQTEFDNIESMSATKADKVSPATTDNILAMDANGNLKDGGIAKSKLYYSGGTDVALADGGTGASTAADARTNLGLGGLATLNSVGTSQIDDGSVGTAKLVTGEQMTTTNVLAKTAAATRGAVGSYSFLTTTAVAVEGDATVAGSSLKYTDTQLSDGASPAGTWRNMGNQIRAIDGDATLFLRIS